MVSAIAPALEPKSESASAEQVRAHVRRVMRKLVTLVASNGEGPPSSPCERGGNEPLQSDPVGHGAGG